MKNETGCTHGLDSWYCDACKLEAEKVRAAESAALRARAEQAERRADDAERGRENWKAACRKVEAEREADARMGEGVAARLAAAEALLGRWRSVADLAKDITFVPVAKETDAFLARGGG